MNKKSQKSLFTQSCTLFYTSAFKEMLDFCEKLYPNSCFIIQVINTFEVLGLWSLVNYLNVFFSLLFMFQFKLLI